MKIRSLAAGVALAAGLAAAPVAEAQTRVTLNSAKAGSSYYQMAVQIAEAAREATGGAIDLTVEESQGSVRNVMEARARGADYVFTAPPSLVADARAGQGKCEGRGSPAFEGARALFPLPALTMHVVVAEATGAARWWIWRGSRSCSGRARSAPPRGSVTSTSSASPTR